MARAVIKGKKADRGPDGIALDVMSPGLLGVLGGMRYDSQKDGQKTREKCGQGCIVEQQIV
jgi:hypothetical protein